MENRKLIEVQKELLASSYNQAMAYTNLIILGGYAGLFAIWNFVKQAIPKGQVLWIGLLATISLFSFVLFEIYKMFFSSRNLLELSKLVNNPSEFAENILSYQNKERDRSISFGKIWIFFLVLTVGTGFGAGSILIYAFVKNIWILYSL